MVGKHELGGVREGAVSFLNLCGVPTRCFRRIGAPSPCFELVAPAGAVKPYSLFLCFVEHAVKFADAYIYPRDFDFSIAF